MLNPNGMAADRATSPIDNQTTVRIKRLATANTQ